MSEESNILEFRRPEPDAAPAIDGLGDCDVHSNNDCDVHSTGDDWNVHSSDAVDVTPKIVPTQETYPVFQRAFDYLNPGVFDNKVPNCMITLQPHKGSYGYFIGDRYGRTDGQRAGEIAINPQHLDRRPEHILSTLAHEMVHSW
jgi:hypothetical protein